MKTTAARPAQGITTSSTAEYFAKNLQQVGFSSPTKAVLTTLKEAFDNSLDACEEHHILPTIDVVIEKLGLGSMKNTDQVLIRVTDNGPGIAKKDVARVFGEYLASSKFGRGRCSRGQQGIGISAATTWAMQTSAKGVQVLTKMAGQKRAISCSVEVNLKANHGMLKNEKEVDWDCPHGTMVEFVIDGRIQLNGEAGIINFLKSNILVNPHLTLSYTLPETEKVHSERVSVEIPIIPDATEPHPHTMKLGEFLAHARIFGKVKTAEWLRTGFSRVGPKVLSDLVAAKKLSQAPLNKNLTDLSDAELKAIFAALQDYPLLPPATTSVLSVGEDALAKSIQKVGNIDFFSVVTRRPAICDFKPIQVEVAIARLEVRGIDHEEPVQVMRFANRVPLQFDKAGCAIVKAISTVNWKTYGLKQPRSSLPLGPYIIAVSVVSPFIKFKNASKETIDASDELVEELRRALIQAGQRLSKHIRKEHREADLEEKIQHIEKFGPILVEALVRITGASNTRKDAATKGLMKLLGRDAAAAESSLIEAKEDLAVHLKKQRQGSGRSEEERNELEGEDDEVLVLSNAPARNKAKAKAAKTKPAKTKPQTKVVKAAKVAKATKKKAAPKPPEKAAKKAPAKAKVKAKSKPKAAPKPVAKKKLSKKAKGKK